MKRIICSLALIITGGCAAAQFTVSLVVSSTPPGTLSEWGSRRDVFTMLVTNQAGGTAPRQVKIKTDIKLADGTTVATTDLAKAAVFTFPQGNTVLNALQAVPLENMIFTGSYKRTLERTGKLPAETYQVCVRLVTATDFVPVSEERCRNFVIASLQLPIPTLPLDGSTINADAAQTAIIFRWTPLAPRQGLPATYRIQVFEVLPGQTPMQAFRSNLPLVDRPVGITQFIWQPQLVMTDADSAALHGKGKPFVWTIQTLDAAGQPVSDGNVNGDGRSEPIVFYVKKPKATVPAPGSN